MSDVLSILDQSIARREESLADETVTLPVPGWTQARKGRRDLTLLATKHRVPGEEDLKAFAQAQIDAGRGSLTDQGIAVALQFLVKSTVRLLVEDPDTGKLEEVLQDGQPITWHELGTRMAAQPARPGAPLEAADVMRHLLLTLNPDTGERYLNVAALDSYAGKVNAWARDTSASVEGALLGESKG